MFKNHQHCVKYRNFTYVPGVEYLRKGTVSPEFWANCSKLCGNCALLQNSYTRKLGEITVFYAVRAYLKNLIVFICLFGHFSAL